MTSGNGNIIANFEWCHLQMPSPPVTTETETGTGTGTGTAGAGHEAEIESAHVPETGVTVHAQETATETGGEGIQVLLCVQWICPQLSTDLTQFQNRSHFAWEMENTKYQKQ